MDFTAELKKKAELVEAALDKYVPIKENYQRNIYEAMRYSLLGGGKRIRGVLTIMSCLLAGGTIDDALPFAAAVEMIHAYSLIHDDLPAMDNDDYRRGKPTSHIVFGEAMAILAGDALLGYAFETILKHAPQNERSWKALHVLAKNAGIEGMLGGQVVDMESEIKKINYEQLIYLQQHKTGALIKASCLMGAITGGADELLQDKLAAYAEKIGLAFQVRDDILDVEGNSAIMGKNIHSDENNNKATFVSICGMKKAKNMVNELSQSAAADMSGINEYGDFLSEFALYLVGRIN